jgi:hypothetical protein
VKSDGYGPSRPVKETYEFEYEEGCRARSFGDPREANPYPPKRPSHIAWESGWAQVERLNRVKS